MLIQIPRLLSSGDLATVRERLEKAAWVDGRVTAGPQSAMAKANLQLAEDSTDARELGDIVVRALQGNPTFLSATLARTVYPPLFNKYETGMNFGTHIDNAIRQVPGTPMRIRTDISATLFLNAPEDYDGGELLIEDTYGAHAVKLGAGDLILYPATSLHRVAPVTRGARLASFFWVQSLVPEDSERQILFDMDRAIAELSTTQPPDSAAILRLTGAYHNLVRKWTVI
jgi:PKHD-type hydroxylase